MPYGAAQRSAAISHARAHLLGNSPAGNDHSLWTKIWPPARRSQQCVLGLSGTPTGKSPLLAPEQDRENPRSKSCGTPLFWCLFWNPSCLFLGLKAALNTLPDLAADRLPRGCRPPSKQHFRSIALILLHSPNICRINPFKQASDQTVAWLKKLAKKRTEP